MAFGRRLATALLLWLIVGTSWATRTMADEPMPAKIRVLFIGNSYTHTFSIPVLIADLFASQGVLFEHESDTPGGASLSGHWSDGFALATIRRGGWDYVVLQDQSSRPLSDRDGVIVSVAQFDAEIRKVGARTLVYQTWPMRDSPGNGPYINETYRLAAAGVGAILVPVGTGWPAAVTAVGSTAMYVSDGSHPSTVGAYLSALTFYRTLSRQTTVGLPKSSNVNQSQATAMQNAADGVALAATVPPAFNLAAGTYAGAQRVTLTIPTPRATIYYTTDGSTPTAASAHLPDGGVLTLTQSATIKALAIGAGTTSAVTTAAYVINATTGQTLLGNGSVNQLATAWPGLPAQLATINPGFENAALTPWGGYGSGAHAVDATLPHTGAKSAQSTAPSGYTRYVTGLQASTAYEARLWTRGGTDVSSAAWSAQMFSNPSVQVSTTVPNRGLPLAWRQVARRFTTDAATTQVQLVYNQNSDNAALDDLEFYKVPEGYELGLKFRSAVGGRITALRVWRPPGGPAAYTLRLWDAGSPNVPLETVSVSGLSATGWVEVALPTPRAITANVPYVVSYGVAEGGFYEAEPNGLQSAITTGALSSVAADNGVYALARGTFPATATGSNYSADVRFVPYTPLQAWRADYFTPAELNNPALEATRWGDLADADRDGWSNYLEYAVERSPTLAEPLPAGLAAPAGVPLSLTFKRARAEVTYTVQGTSDLATWTDLAVNPGVVGQTVTVTDPSPSGVPSRFLRLKVTGP